MHRIERAWWVGVCAVSLAIIIIAGSFTFGAKIVADFPLSTIDKKIDELGTESRIHSEGDAEAYIDALLEKYKIDDTRLPGLPRFKARLIRAEYAGVRDSSKRIDERVVAEAFNKIMDRWGTPVWTRISIKEFHAVRVLMSSMLYPHAAPRSSDGHVADRCRPVEALYLIYLLETNRRVLPGIRELLKTGRWPGEDLLMEQKKVARREVRPASGTQAEPQRDQEYVEARTKYFQDHPSDDITVQINELFAALSID